MITTLIPWRLKHGKDRGGKDGKSHGDNTLLVDLKSKSLPNRSEEHW